MDYREDQKCPGLVPSGGAIFMSNRATKRECLKRGLLGLPSAQSNFVKQVKAGMVLFLFEFEKRKLYGVFQASSNGALNIMPGALSSAGKQFPAQVKFIPIWNCDPLYEDEFRDAIRENYFSPKKFNFGLSERQVKRLLVLFSSRKLNKKSLQRQVIHGKFPRAIRYSTKKSGIEAEGGSFAMIGDEKDDAEDGFGSSIATPLLGDMTGCYESSDDVNHASHMIRNAYNVNGLLVPNEHFSHSPSEIEKLVDGGWFLTRDSRKEDGDIEPRSVMTDYLKCPLDSNKRTLDDVGFASRSQLGDQYNDDNSFRPLASTGLSASFLSNSPVYSSKPIPEAEFLSNDQFRQYSFQPSVSPESSVSFLYKFPFPSRKAALEPNSLMNDQFTQSSAVDQLLGLHEPVHHFSAPHGDAVRLSNNVYSIAHESLSSSLSSAEHPYSVSGSPHKGIYPVCDSRPFSSYSDHKGSSRCLEITDHENLARSTPIYEFDVRNSQSSALGHRKATSNCLDVTAHEDFESRTLQYKLDVQKKQSLPLEHPYCTSKTPCSTTCPVIDVLPFSAGLKESSRCTDIKSLVGNDFPSSYDSHHEYLNGNGQVLPKTVYTDCMARTSSWIKMTNNDACSFPSNLDTKDYQCQASSGKKHNHELLQGEENEAFISGTLEDGSARSLDHANHKHNRSESLHKSRCSVFSRLASLPRERREDENVLDLSVDEVMSMLHRSRHQWDKAKKVKQPVKNQDRLPDFRNDKEIIASSCKLGKCCSPNISENLFMNNIPDGKENGIQGAEGIPFLDFKRRSKVRKRQDNANSRNNIDSGENAGLSLGQQKRRKLIRPKFSVNELVMVGVQDNGLRIHQNIELSDAPQHIDCESQNIGAERHSIEDGKEMAKSCVVSMEYANEGRERLHDACFDKVCQNIELSEKILQISSENMGADAERCLIFEGKEMACSKMTSFPNSDEGQKEALQDAGVQKPPSSVCCQQEISADEVLYLKNYESDGLSKQQSNCDSSSLKESCSESVLENPENGEGCSEGGGNLSASDVQGRFLPVNGGIVMNIKENSQIIYSAEAEEVTKASTELGQVEGCKDRLALEPDSERCEGSFGTASSFEAKESNATYKENTMRPMVVAVSAKEGRKIDLEQEIGGGNHFVPGSCEDPGGQREKLSSNSIGEEKEMQRVERVDRGFDLNLCNQNDDVLEAGNMTSS